MPNAAVDSLRNETISRTNGTTGSKIASPRPTRIRCGVSRPIAEWPTAIVAANPATAIDTASPLIPATSSPTRWVSSMYIAQQSAAPSAYATPTRSTVPAHGSVRSTTPTPARTGHRTRPRPRSKATVSGPKNSNALAVPSGRRSTAAMNRSVMPAVTTPRTTQARNALRVNAEGRGLTMIRRMMPAQASRSHAAPSAPS